MFPSRHLLPCDLKNIIAVTGSNNQLFGKNTSCTFTRIKCRNGRIQKFNTDSLFLAHHLQHKGFFENYS